MMPALPWSPLCSGRVAGKNQGIGWLRTCWGGEGFTSLFSKHSLRSKAWAGFFSQSENQTSELRMNSNSQIPISVLPFYRWDLWYVSFSVFIHNRNNTYPGVIKIKWYKCLGQISSTMRTTHTHTHTSQKPVFPHFHPQRTKAFKNLSWLWSCLVKQGTHPSFSD